MYPNPQVYLISWSFAFHMAFPLLSWRVMWNMINFGPELSIFRLFKYFFSSFYLLDLFATYMNRQIFEEIIMYKRKSKHIAYKAINQILQQLYF